MVVLARVSSVENQVRVRTHRASTRICVWKFVQTVEWFINFLIQFLIFLLSIFFIRYILKNITSTEFKNKRRYWRVGVEKSELCGVKGSASFGATGIENIWKSSKNSFMDLCLTRQKSGKFFCYSKSRMKNWHKFFKKIWITYQFKKCIFIRWTN